MRRFALIALALAAGVSQTAAAEPPTGETILPGWWETTSRVTSPLPSEKTERRCITAADVEKFLLGPTNHHYDCNYPTRSYSDGRIVLKGQCVNRKHGDVVDVAGTGSYTPTSFHLAADVQFRLAGLPITGRATTDAHRLSESCPAPGAG